MANILFDHHRSLDPQDIFFSTQEFKVSEYVTSNSFCDTNVSSDFLVLYIRQKC